VASPNIYSGGYGGSTGAVMTSASTPIAQSGNTWYVDSVSGSDAASPRGRDRARPLATLAQALTNASANDSIVFFSGHTQTLTAITTLSLAGLKLFGEGSGSTRPQFIRNMNDELFDITAAGVRLENLYFPGSTTTSALSKVRTAGANTKIINCYLEADDNDTGAQIELVTGGDSCEIRDTTIISTATAVSAQPASAILVTNAVSDLTLDTVVLNGGSTSWSNPFAFVGTGAVTRLYAENLDLLNDSDVTLATGTTGFVMVRNKSGSARIVWAA
jgi:hypothetical protein